MQKEKIQKTKCRYTIPNNSDSMMKVDKIAINMKQKDRFELGYDKLIRIEPID